MSINLLLALELQIVKHIVERIMLILYFLVCILNVRQKLQLCGAFEIQIDGIQTLFGPFVGSYFESFTIKVIIERLRLALTLSKLLLQDLSKNLVHMLLHLCSGGLCFALTCDQISDLRKVYRLV